MIGLEDIFVLSYYISEPFFFFDFMDNIFTRKPKFTVEKSIILFTLLSISSYVIMSIKGISIYLFIIKYLCFTIASCFIFKDSIRDKLIQSTIFFLSIFLINFFMIVITSFNNHDMKFILNNRICIVTYIYFSELLLFVICKCILLILKMRKRHISKIYINYLISAIAISLVGTICLLEIIFNISSDTVMLQYIVAIVFCWSCMNFCVYLSFIKVWKSTLEKEKFEIIELKNSFIEKHIMDKNNYDMEIRKISHDMDNHFNCIAFLLKKSTPEAALKYVEDMMIYKHYYHVISTGNPIIDAILNQKKSIAEDNNISFEYNIQLNTEITIKSVDLCSFLSNAIDNAIEGSKNVDNISERKITVSIHTQKGYLCMKISNSVKADPSSLFNNSITTKANKSKHGLGVMSMKNITRTYFGNMSTNYEDGLFSVKSIFKL